MRTIKKIILTAISAFMLIIINVFFCQSAFAADPVTINIPVYKQISEGEPTTDELFSFALMAQDDEPMPQGSISGIKTVTISGEGEAVFGEITYTEPGNYYYDIYEIEGANERYEYDDMVYSLTVQVTWVAEADGELQAVMYLSEKDGTDKYENAVFENTYNYSEVSIDPPVSKAISGDTPSMDSTFLFYMAADDSSYPMPNGTFGGTVSVTVTGEGTEDFGSITYTEPGEYTYTVYEHDSGVKGYEYDAIIYTMKVTVSEVNGVLSAVRQISDNMDRNSSSLLFVNVYTSPETPKTGDNSILLTCWIILGLALMGMGISLYIKYVQDKKSGDSD